MSIMVAQPMRATTLEVFRQRSAELVESFTYPKLERVVYENEQPYRPGKYAGNAAARNELITKFLRKRHTHVLWLDIDIIEAPVDLVERLLAISKANDGAVVAPMVWMEQVREGPPSLQNGGWFYDTGGFIKDGQWARFVDGVPGEEPIEEMESVGCCYLVPAELYRMGCTYAPVGREVEHVSFCRQVRGLGVKVLAVRELEVIHAYLPKYGEAWH